jgi:hypothetical protein
LSGVPGEALDTVSQPPWDAKIMLDPGFREPLARINRPPSISSVQRSRQTADTTRGSTVRWRVAQVSDVFTDWRWLTLFAIVTVVVGVVASVSWSRRRPHITELPSSLFARRHPPAGNVEDPRRGPPGGRVVRLEDAPYPAPHGRAVLADSLPPPPLAAHRATDAPPLPYPDHPVAVIDLTELESVPAVGTVLDLRDVVVDLTSEEDLASLPADPWS